MKACKEKKAGGGPRPRATVGYRGLAEAARLLENGHGGKGVAIGHLRMVLNGTRESASLLRQVRERFPELLPPDGGPWRADRPPDGGA